MFTTSFTRALRSTATLPPSALKPRACVTAPSALYTSDSRGTHERRHSSSKASCPPDRSRGASSPQRTPASAAVRPGAEGPKRHTGAGGRRRARDPSLAAAKAKYMESLNLPSVPSTQHLHPSDISLSCFFSQHRPISVNTAIPTSSTEDSFNTIFEPKPPTGLKPSEVFFTLAKAVETLDTMTQAKEDERESRWEILQSDESAPEPAIHLDGIQRQISLDELIARFRPFNVPPVPVPSADIDQVHPARKRWARNVKLDENRSHRPKQKSWATTIVVTESTYSNGDKTYTAANSPIVQVPVTTRACAEEDAEEARQSQPFLRRMLMRQRRWEEYIMRRWDNAGQRALLISVKRQRKLKMKKHKYKKLMKRTRNLRRRLDRK